MFFVFTIRVFFIPIISSIDLVSRDFYATHATLIISTVRPGGQRVIRSRVQERQPRCSGRFLPVHGHVPRLGSRTPCSPDNFMVRARFCSL